MKRLIISVTLIIMTVCTVLAGNVTLPKTPAAERLSSYLETVNSGDESLWEGFASGDAWARQADDEMVTRRMKMLEDTYAMHGGFDIKEIKKSSEHSIEVLVKARKISGVMDWFTLMLDTEPESPYRIAGIGIRPADDPNLKVPEGKLTTAELVRFIDDLVGDLYNRDLFSGAVLVAEGDEIIYDKAYGLASKRYDVPNKTDTKFNLGSMNKMFTGVAIAQLVEAGKLSYDDYIIKYLPDYPNQDAARKIQIHHLLTHTSGLGSYWDELFAASWTQIRTVDQLLDLFAAKPLDFEPGERFQYSNSGPIVLGKIIEVISGMSYYDYVREHIYTPAGMIDTDCYEMDRPTPNLAIGYTHLDYDGQQTEGPRRNNLFLHTVKGGPAGGGYSTVEDMFRFAKALRANTLINETSYKTITEGKVDMGPNLKYGYLFGISDENGHKVVGHNGGAPGISAKFSMIDNGYTVVVLSNYDRIADMIGQKIIDVLVR